jgi:hypothetical protein
MTFQASDHLYLGNKKYLLIDVEDGKQLIDLAVFDMPEHNDQIVIISTDCWRGYTANYYVTRNVLYGVKNEETYSDDLKRDRKIRSPRKMIPFTGGCIIGRGDPFNEDFLESYLDCDEAYELSFENGVLKEKRSLSSAIEKARLVPDNDDKWTKIKMIAREPLKHRYGQSTYKWQATE